jgi:hypothetical protein
VTARGDSQLIDWARLAPATSRIADGRRRDHRWVVPAEPQFDLCSLRLWLSQIPSRAGTRSICGESACSRRRSSRVVRRRPAQRFCPASTAAARESSTRTKVRRVLSVPIRYYTICTCYPTYRTMKMRPWLFTLTFVGFCYLGGAGAAFGLGSPHHAEIVSQKAAARPLPERWLPRRRHLYDHRLRIATRALRSSLRTSGQPRHRRRRSRPSSG